MSHLYRRYIEYFILISFIESLHCKFADSDESKIDEYLEKAIYDDRPATLNTNAEWFTWFMHQLDNIIFHKDFINIRILNQYLKSIPTLEKYFELIRNDTYELLEEKRSKYDTVDVCKDRLHLYCFLCKYIILEIFIMDYEFYTSKQIIIDYQPTYELKIVIAGEIILMYQWIKKHQETILENESFQKNTTKDNWFERINLYYTIPYAAFSMNRNYSKKMEKSKATIVELNP